MAVTNFWKLIFSLIVIQWVFIVVNIFWISKRNPTKECVTPDCSYNNDVNITHEHDHIISHELLHGHKETHQTDNYRSDYSADTGYNSITAHKPPNRKSSHQETTHSFLDNEVYFKEFEKYPPRLSHHHVLDGSSFAINCAGKIEHFASKLELEYHLEKQKFPFSKIPIAGDVDYWFGKTILSLVNEFRVKKMNKEFNLAIIIPLRRRCNHVKYSIPYLHYFLQDHIDGYRIFVIEQNLNDKKTFNRAALLNVGYLLANHEAKAHGKEYDYYIFHDVDMLPLDGGNAYSYSPYVVHRGVFRNAVCPDVYELNFDGYFGGVTQFSKEVFESINGYSNAFWGWGREDDECFGRWTDYLENNIESKGIPYPQLLRPEIDDGKYFVFNNSTERSHEKNLKKKKTSMRHNELQLLLMVHKQYGLRKHIMKQNGFKQLEEEVRILDYKVDEYLSFYSIEFLMTMNESRSWSERTTKFLPVKIRKRHTRFRGEYLAKKHNSIFYGEPDNWIRNPRDQFEVFGEEPDEEGRKCEDETPTVLNGPLRNDFE